MQREELFVLSIIDTTGRKGGDSMLISAILSCIRYILTFMVTIYLTKKLFNMGDFIDESTNRFPTQPLHLHKYINRLKTFDTWPKYFHIQPAQLAHAGFVYTGYSDKVHCYSCKGVVRNWEKNDIPFYEHAKLYPECDLVCRLLPTDPIGLLNFFSLKQHGELYNRVENGEI